MVFPWQDGWLAHTGDPVFCFVRPPYLGPLLGFTHCFLIISGGVTSPYLLGCRCQARFYLFAAFLRFSQIPCSIYRLAFAYCFSFSLFRVTFPYCQSLPLDYGSRMARL
jgi:hypothetical protein